MPVDEQDLILLETFLDDALEPGEAESLNQRLKTEPQLIAALDELRAQRSLRAVAWQSIEPTPVDTQQLIWRVRGAMLERREQQLSYTIRPWNRWSTVAAACVVLAFFGGWFGRAHQGPVTPYNTGQALSLNTNPTTPTPTNVLVPVTNEYGQVVAFQPFQNSEEARHFTEDLNRTQVPALGAPLDDKVNLTSFEKY